jgi:TolB protein
LLRGLLALVVACGIAVSPQQSSRGPFASDATAAAPQGRIAFAAYRHGNWDIYSIRPDGADLRRITTDPAEDRSPTWSPDGSRLAFQSRRASNWDIYTVSITNPIPQRLTADPAYDGAPAWSPDGSRIAFESYRAGDLDVWMMNPDGADQVNLTADSPSGDFDPAWSPDGSRLAFTSWRMGDNDVFTMALPSKVAVQWNDSTRPEGGPVWTPDGRSLCFVQDEVGRREIYLGSAAHAVAKADALSRLTWQGRDASPAWSPDGRQLAYISYDHAGYLDAEHLVIQRFGDVLTSTVGLPLAASILEGWEIAGPLSWTAVDASLGQPMTAADRQEMPMPQSKVTPNVNQPYGGFVELADVKAPNARLHPALIEQFQGTREQIRLATGYDFLSELSDMWRGLDARNDTSSFMSWHKAGRAFDELFDYRGSNGMPALEVVREDMGGEAYWRVFMKAATQDGTLGQPLKTAPWNTTGPARRKYLNDGGTWKPVPYGYYVDVTEVLRHNGWERISAVDREDFNWRWNFLAIEYWHVQRRDGLNWYQAMEQVYREDALSELFNWRALIREQEKPYSVYCNGIPVPPNEAQWTDVRP